MSDIELTPRRLSSFECATLRLRAFEILKGWGEVGEDGKWKSWNGDRLRTKAADLVLWALGDAMRCSFCDKDQFHVKKLIAGPAVFACDECINLMFSLLQEPQAVPSEEITKSDEQK